MSAAAPETQAFWRHPRFADLAMLQARFTRHRYALHTHPTYVIALVTEGCERLRVGRHRVLAPAGQVILVNPEEPHDGEAGTEAGWAYRTFYPPVALMADVAAELGLHRPPLFASPLLHDPVLAGALAVAHAEARRGDAVAAETSLLLALRQLILRHADRTSRVEAMQARGARRRMATYAALIEERLAGDIALGDLSAAAGVTRFQVIRDMRRVAGMTPGAYIRTHRLRRAAQLIARGEALAGAAAAAGFADQSHLTRLFRAVHGITPRTWQAAFRAAD
jgi:AraC-like DNA-binding protein